MYSLLRRLSPGLLAICLAVSGAFAQAPTGTVVGRVTDAKVSLGLGGVLVQVEGTALQTYTTNQGDYTLFNVPAGSAQVRFSYVGYPSMMASTTVTADATARLDAAFLSNDLGELETFVVEGAAVGTARALNLQRAAPSLTNLVAADEIGNFPDQNAAESLQRIPGLSLYRDQGEGRYVVVRGLNYTYTSVELDGVAFAGADLGERATALDVISSDQLAAIEVSKAPTPDQDAEGIAGKVDVKTKSPFDRDDVQVNVGVQGIYSEITSDWGYKLNADASWLSADRRWGFLVSASRQERNFASYNFESGGAWSEETSPTDGSDQYFLEEVDFREYEVERTRTGASATAEYRPDDATKLFLRANYSNFVDAENRWLTRIPFAEGDITALTSTSGTVEDMRRISRRLRQREKDQEVHGFILGGEKVIDNWTIDATAGFSEGEERRPNEQSVNFRRSTRDGTFSYNFTNPYDFTVTQSTGADLYDPASYNQLNAVEIADEYGQESSADFGLNFRVNLETQAPAYLKFGARYRTREKTSEAEVVEYSGSAAGLTFADTARGPGNYPFLPINQIDPALFNAAFAAARSSLSFERLFEDSELDDWTTDEEIMAAYLMAGMSFGRFSVIAGARWEQTEFTAQGKTLNLDNETASIAQRDRRYDNFLPGVHLRYDVTDALVLRASWTNSIARPDFSQTAFYKSINNDDQEISVGNPDLETLESMNWDASVEYYLPSLGVLSAAVFYKDIENFSFETVDPAGDPAFPGYEVTTFLNGGKGRIQGLELAYQQQLRGLPAPFDGLGVMANITFLDSSAFYPTRAGESVPFVGQSDYVGNVGLTYEKGGFFARAAVNFRSERLREDEPIGGNRFEDLIVDDFAQLDLTVRYKFSKNLIFFTELVNITDEPFRVFQRSPDGTTRLGQWEEYGWSANVGFRWSL